MQTFIIKKSNFFFTIIFFIGFSNLQAQEKKIDHSKIKKDLYQILNDISQYYAYVNDKNIDLNCLLNYYEAQIPKIKTEEETVLFFEYLLDEFYDSHVMLNTNRNSSYRLNSPIYFSLKNGKPIISNIWQSQIEDLEQQLIGTELLKFNGNDINEVIAEFPTHCNDKNDPEVKEWIINKIVAGRYNEPRLLTLKREDKKIIELDLDEIKLKNNTGLLSAKVENGIGIIRLNNSLGNNDLVSEFDAMLDTLLDTKGLILDLRNTVGGGNSYVARGIMGRFVNEKKPYQTHQVFEKYDGSSLVERSWVEYVSPRNKIYQKPVVVLVGRWTGSMGEGMAVGFEGMGRGEIVGSEMQRLAGEMTGTSFKHQTYGYRLSIAKLYHVNGTLREKYIPTNYIAQTTTKKDEVLEKGIELLTTGN
ncbi:carboxyl-terminal processing protease [Marivirga sericea]|uniref:Carboxyl-terminal processing protease n=1 Tax=Marivirga sericea TaxID=1028 RepID=A0A1X7JLS5_9BACT|nr:S41 family peptidase [Marivirga sericea]SMG28868.1 carboxyl-terminal processing protease [Marivirga sericea]